MTAAVCTHCGHRWAWMGGLWCWRCIYDTCCSTYPKRVRGEWVTRCVHGDELRDMAQRDASR